MYLCNPFTPQIKGSFYGLNVMYHNHSSPGVLQLPRCATISQWNVVQLPIGMHIIMLQYPLKCYNDTRKPMQTSWIIILYIVTPYRLSYCGFEFVSDKIVFRVRFVHFIDFNLVVKCSFYILSVVIWKFIHKEETI